MTHFLPKSATFETLFNDQVHKTFVCLLPENIAVIIKLKIIYYVCAQNFGTYICVSGGKKC